LEDKTVSIQYSEKEVLFRKLVPSLPSTTYATFALYRYPAKFIPQVIAYVLDSYGRPGMTVFDPYAGYGTVGVVSKVYGYDYELWDINPLLEVLHNVATMEPREVDINNLLNQMVASEKNFVPQWSNFHYWFHDKFLPLLSKAWGFYHSLENKWLKNLLVVPLLKTTRYFSYDDPQRQKLSKSPRAEERVKSLLASNWQTLFYQMLAENLKEVIKKVREYWQLFPKPVRAMVRGGVDTLSTELDEERDIIITSPPYLQAQEYIRHAKMDLFWLGYHENTVKELSKLEVPYRELAACVVNSETFFHSRKQIEEPHLQVVFDRYFWGVLGALTQLQKKIRSYLFLFVGPATIRGRPVPIDRIFAEHFASLGWIHEVTLKDTIVSRRMFFYRNNPATGLKDQRMRTESLVVLRKESKS